MGKDHLQVILEDMNSKFDLVLEGHASLDRKIYNLAKSTTERFDLIDFKIDALNQKIDAVSADLKAHRDDTEAHGGIYRVRKT